MIICDKGGYSFGLDFVIELQYDLRLRPNLKNTMPRTTRFIAFYDTTLRDGEQTPNVSFSPEAKLRLARQLETLGMDVIEVGFPAASQQEFEAVQRVSAETRGCQVAALARAVSTDIETTAAALSRAVSPRLSIVVPISDRHLRHSLKWERKQAEEKIFSSVEQAKRLTGEVEFIATDATRTEYAHCRAALWAAASAGADVVVVADTVGVALPDEFGDLISRLIEDLTPEFPDLIIGAHYHNDFGMAVANSLSALRAGAGQVEGTINGLGERAGNTALEEVAMLLRYHEEKLALLSNIQTEEILATSQLVVESSEVPVQPNKALVGRNAFLHAAGMHQQAVLNDPLTFEPFDHRLVGVHMQLDDRIVFGKFLGRNGLKHLLEHDGIKLDDAQIDPLVQQIRRAIEQKQTISRRMLHEMARDLTIH
jgi:2-isopropylmalate synthase